MNERLIHQLDIASRQIRCLQHLEIKAWVDLNVAIWLGQLLLHQVNVVNGTALGLGLAHGEQMQGLGAALIDLILRRDHRTYFAITVVVAVNISRLHEQRAPTHPLTVHEGNRTTGQLAALGEVAPIPLAAVDVVHLHNLDALTLGPGRPDLPLRPVVVRAPAVVGCGGVDRFLAAWVHLIGLFSVHPDDAAKIAGVRKVRLA